MDRVNSNVEFTYALNMITSGVFSEYIFPSIIEDLLVFQQNLRDKINASIPIEIIKQLPNKRLYYPDYYDIGMLLFIYQTDNALLNSGKIHSWDSMKDIYKTDKINYFDLQKDRFIDKQRDTNYSCLCGWTPIKHLCYIEDNGQYALLGSYCVGKNKGALKDQLKLATSYTCTSCHNLYSNDAGDKSISMCKRCINNGMKMNCLKCTEWKNCINNLCNGCSKTWKICYRHPTSIVSIKRNICAHCVEQDALEKQTEYRERYMMRIEDPLIEHNMKQMKLRHDKLVQAEIDRQEAKKKAEQKILDTTQKCLDCPMRLTIHSFIVRCIGCYKKHRNPVATVSKCITCKTSIEPSTWKTKCRSCYLNKHT